MASAGSRYTSGSDREPFVIEVGPDGMVSMKGRLDASQVPKAEAALSRVEGSVIADLEGLAYISSAGIGSLVKTLKRLQESGGTFTLVNLSPSIRNIFHYAGLDQIFVIE